MLNLGDLENPIKCDGPAGERAYLCRLLGPDKQFLIFEREGSCSSPISNTMIDRYRMFLLDGSFIKELYLDMYHTAYEETAIPLGFSWLNDPKVKHNDFPNLQMVMQQEETLKQQYGEHNCKSFMYVHTKGWSEIKIHTIVWLFWIRACGSGLTMKFSVETFKTEKDDSNAKHWSATERKSKQYYK